MTVPIFHVRALIHIVVGENDAPIPTLEIVKIIREAFVCNAVYHFYVIHCAMKKQLADLMNLKFKLRNGEFNEFHTIDTC